MPNWIEPAFALATPELYDLNAFRLLELPVEATSRELTRRRDYTQRALSNGLPLPPGPGQLLARVPAPDTHDVQQAEHALQDAERRLVHEFFWFWPLNPGTATTDPALRMLATGDMRGAMKLWEQYSSRPGPDRAVARHNLAVLHYHLALEAERAAPSDAAAGDEHWKKALHFWDEVIDDDDVWRRVAERIRDIDDPSLTTGASRRLQQTLPGVLALVQARLAMRALDRDETEVAQRHAERIRRSGESRPGVNEALNRVVEPLRAQVKAIAETAKRAGEQNKAGADKILETFLVQAAPLLRPFDLFLDADHPARQAEHDNVALAAFSCAIDYGNETGNSRRTLALFDKFGPLAEGAAARNRIAHNRTILEQNMALDQCWFCKQRDAQKSAAIEVKMHGDVKRIPIVNGVRMTWRHNTITVPRCNECRRRANKVALYVFFGVLLASFIVVVILRALNRHGGPLDGDDVSVMIFGNIPGLLIASIAAGITHESKLSAKNNFPRIKELQAQGWKFGEKPT